MKQVLLCIFMAIAVAGCKEKAEKEMEQEETTEMAVEPAQKGGEWKVLFDGSSFDAWKGYQRDDVPEHWKIEDGAMVFYPPENKPEGENYNLVTRQDFGSFALSLEWKIAEGGNSGVIWAINEDEKYSQPYETGPEIQVLDNERHPDAKAGTTHQAGALYDMVAPTEDVSKPAGEWNTMLVTVDHEEKRGSVELNGVKIVDFPVADEMWNVMVSKSKFADWEGFGKFNTGKIGLQDHDDKVAYRNIKIREL